MRPVTHRRMFFSFSFMQVSSQEPFHYETSLPPLFQRFLIFSSGCQNHSQLFSGVSTHLPLTWALRVAWWSFPVSLRSFFVFVIVFHPSFRWFLPNLHTPHSSLPTSHPNIPAHPASLSRWQCPFRENIETSRKNFLHFQSPAIDWMFVSPQCIFVVVVQSLSHVRLFATPWTAACQASLSFTISPGVCSNSRPLSHWCHPTISSSFISFCPQSFPASGLFQWVGSSHQVAKVLELQLQHQSSQWIFRVDFL